MAADRAALHAPFTGYRSSRVAWSLAALQALGLLAVVLVMGDQLNPADQVGFAVVAVATGWFLSRLARVAAFPDETGLTVRNLLLTRRLEWAEVVSLRFGGGDPWVLLDLSDGENLAVMAIQRADGERGRAESRRLATLVALHAVPDRPAG